MQDAAQVEALCLRLAKFKKENKELLTYLLFEASDEQAFINGIKEEIDSQFNDVNRINLYQTKKGLRKILRLLNVQIRYSGIPTTELTLRIYFCQTILDTKVPVNKSQVLINLYMQQLKKINQVLTKLDDDLQFDYQSAIEKITP